MKDKLSQLYNAGFDRLYGISTQESPGTRTGQKSEVGDQARYVPIDYIALMYLFAGIKFRPHDVFVDIGCGLGRAVLIAARRRIRAAIGIEYDPVLARQAEGNKRTLRGARANIDIRKQDAARADFDEGTIFWMYNPFGERTMSTVLDRLRLSLRTNPRDILIVYAHPRLSRQVDQQHWLQRAGERRFPTAGENGHAIYWSSKPIGAGADTVFGWIRSELSPATKGTTLKSGTDR